MGVGVGWGLGRRGEVRLTQGSRALTRGPAGRQQASWQSQGSGCVRELHEKEATSLHTQQPLPHQSGRRGLLLGGIRRPGAVQGGDQGGQARQARQHRLAALVHLHEVGAQRLKVDDAGLPAAGRGAGTRGG